LILLVLAACNQQEALPTAKPQVAVETSTPVPSHTPIPSATASSIPDTPTSTPSSAATATNPPPSETPSPTQTATPEPIKLSEIDPFDPEIRMYHRNQDGVIREIPYGAFHKSPGIHDLSSYSYYDEAGLKEFFISAVLVDLAYFDDSDNSLTYPLGIPDASGNLNVFYLKEFISGPDGEHFQPIIAAYSIGKGARASPTGDYLKYPLDEIMPWLHQIVGRQVLFHILVDENGGSEDLREYVLDNIRSSRPVGVVPDIVPPRQIDPLNVNACGDDQKCRRLTIKANNMLNGFLETNDALWAVINGDPSQYKERIIAPRIFDKYIPTPRRS
jgi:hypothetical protein